MRKGCIVTCECGRELGKFATVDDHSGVDIQCPDCGKWRHISNQVLSYPKDNGGEIKSGIMHVPSCKGLTTRR